MQKTMIRMLAASAAVAAMETVPARSDAQGTIIVPSAEDRTTRVGTRGANFLQVGVGARPQALAGAASATIEGPAALFWNPANIVGREGTSALASYMQLFGNSGITNVGGAVTVPVGAGAVGLSVQQYSSGDIERTTANAPTGNDPVQPGTFAWTGTAFGLHYARNITDRLSASVGARFAQEGIDFARNTYFGADISTRFRTGLYGLTLAATVANLGSSSRFGGPGVDRAVTAPRNNGQATGRDLDVTFRTQEAQMPTTFRMGVLADLVGGAESIFGANPRHTLIAEADASKALGGDLQPAFGVEYGFRRAAFARVGKRFFNEQNAPWKFSDGVAVGGGLRLPVLGRGLMLDYAYVTMGELGGNQVFSFDFGF